VKRNGMSLMDPRRIDRRFAAPERDSDYALDRRDALARLIEELSPQQAEAVRLFYLGDVPAREIAAKLGVTIERAGELLAQAERKMREAAEARCPGLCMNGNGR
jgi:RNA polymerase sigma factor (sigma-70 family)